MFQKIKIKFTRLVSLNAKGVTLLELIVAIALLALASSICVSSYTSVMEKQRMQSDMSKLNSIDTALSQILLYDDAFEDIKLYVYDDNKLQINFPLTKSDDGITQIDISQATLNGGTLFLMDRCPTLYNYLNEYTGGIIELNSASYQKGYYRIYLTFSGAKVSEIRDFVITNDSVEATNSGDSEIYPYD